MQNNNTVQIEVHKNQNELPSNTNKVKPSTPDTLDPTKNESNSRFKSAIERVNIFSYIYFFYVLPLVARGYKADKEGKSYQSKDLLTFPWAMRADVLSDKFTHEMTKGKKQDPKKKLNLTKAIMWTCKWPILKIIAVETIFLFTRILSSWFIKKLIDCYVYPDLAPQCWKWAGILSANLMVSFHLEHHFNHLAAFLPNHIQNALINLIFNKITRLSTDNLTKISTGKLLNLCTNGVNVFEQVGMYAANVVVSIFAFIGGCALIWQYFGAYSLIGVGYIVFWYPIQQLVIILSLKERNRTNAAAANRIRMTTETIEAIRLLKMYTWELKFKDKIQALRKIELKMLKNGSYTFAITRAIAFSTQICSSFLMFMAYKVAGHTLETSSVFSAYFIIGYLRLYASYMFSLGLNFLTDARILIKNIEQILETPDISDTKVPAPLDPKNSIEFENFNANWTKADAKRAKEATLTNINLYLKKGSLNALVGAVGSGKTSLLMTLTGEMPETTGALRYSGNIALVEQEPTIFAGTFRENVCFGKPYEPEFYKTVVKACNLESDLKLFPQGDLSEIGEKGNNLSGGQKARLALCRAVYSQADIYLLDDPLSAVDPKVARSIYGNAIEKVLKGKTVLLTTHQVDFARSCENIIIMEEGCVLGSGTYEELKQQGVDVDKVFGNKNSRAVEEQEEAPKQVETTKPKEEEHEDDGNQEGADDKQIKKDQYAPNVTWRTYLGLLKEMGGFKYFFALIFALTSCEMVNNGYGRVLGALIADEFAAWKALTILACFAFYDITCYLARYLILGFGLIRAAKTYHQRMLDRVIQSTVYFFDTNPIGQIISRFSNDVGILDKYIPLAVLDTFNISWAVGSIIITASIVNPILIAPIVAAGVAIGIIFHFCFPAVKQTKLYESKTKGPLFALLSATLSGIVAIRVYKQAEAFQQKFKELLHTTTKANVAYNLTSRFMTFYIDLAYNIAAIGGVFIITATQTKFGNGPNTNAWALALILIINALFQFFLKQFTQLSISIIAVGRVQSYLQTPLEPPLSLPSDDKLKAEHWPQKGEIDFHKAYMKYRPDGDHVIRDLSLHVKAGEKIGCVGRTGAGKSTIIQLLYRMQELDRSVDGTKESSITMDQKNTQDVGLHLLRDNISIIPQMPFIFTGTIRTNVDPLGQFTDDQIWTALEDVRLKHHVEKQPDRLDTQIHGGTSVFSAGQKQLVCLARAILKKSNVLIMDEATANMDYDTDFFVQKKIEQRFSHATQFTIAHRLQTIANYDKVLVLDRGRRMEFDEPYKLLVNNIGDKEATNVNGYFAGMVQNTGPISSKKIFGIARDAYFARHPEQKV